MAEADAHWPVLRARPVLSSCRQVISLLHMATLLVTVVIPLQWVKERGTAGLGNPPAGLRTHTLHRNSAF